MDDAAPLKGTLTIAEAASYLSVSVFTLRRLANNGKVPVARYGSKLHFRISDLDKFVAEHMEAA